ncbi:MAG: Holliday junction resolvase RuvX [Solirubrobacterales bacterium]
MRILALDYGAARIGCAISDRSGTLATPIPSVTSGDPETLAALANDRGAERIVIGLPISLDGAEGGQASETRPFGDRLAELTDVPIEYYDERFTTRMATRTRRESGASSDEDSIAAAHLLEAYLQAVEAGGGTA